jgi:hypothetical protein
MEQSPIASIGSEVIQLSEWEKYQNCFFCMHFTITNKHGEEDRYSLDPVHLEDIAFLLAVKS